MAMQAELRVNYEVVLAKAGEMSNIRNQISSITEELKNDIASLTSSWESEASSAYQNRFNQIHDDIEMMLNIVDEYSSDLTEVAGTYRTAEGMVTDASNALPSDAFGV